MTAGFDIAVVGAGIAGASLAAELAAQGAQSVVLIEAEDQPGYHTTGRSAAFWEECYGGPDVVPLTTRWFTVRYVAPAASTPSSWLPVGAPPDSAGCPEAATNAQCIRP